MQWTGVKTLTCTISSVATAHVKQVSLQGHQEHIKQRAAPGFVVITHRPTLAGYGQDWPDILKCYIIMPVPTTPWIWCQSTVKNTSDIMRINNQKDVYRNIKLYLKNDSISDLDTLCTLYGTCVSGQVIARNLELIVYLRALFPMRMQHLVYITCLKPSLLLLQDSAFISTVYYILKYKYAVGTFSLLIQQCYENHDGYCYEVPYVTVYLGWSSRKYLSLNFDISQVLSQSHCSDR